MFLSISYPECKVYIYKMFNPARADSAAQNGLYYLTGSQMFHMIQNVSESLAGRVGILSRAEIEGRI